jgi:cytoskeleton protein RodZ
VSSVGEQLASARQSKDWTAEDVARLTKLRTDHVLAIEQGRYQVFSAPVYARGSVKSYAKLVNLDPAALVEQLNAEIKAEKPFERGEPLQGAERGFIEGIAYALSRIPWKLVFILIVIIAVLGGALWGMDRYEAYKNSDPLQDLPTGFYQPEAALSEEYLPEPSQVP